MNETILKIALLTICFVLSMVLLFTIRPNKTKKNFLKSLPNSKWNSAEYLMNKPLIAKAIINITTANGIEDDCPEMFFKEQFKAIAYGAIFIVLFGLISLFINRKIILIGILLAIFLAIYPALRRVSDKSDYKKQYVAAFYDFLNYTTLYLSGGVEMKQTLFEVSHLIPEDSVIYPRIKATISKNAISGMSGDTYISTLETLNEGLDYPEIRNFINLAKRSQARGDAVTDSLLDQIDDISKKIELSKRSAISKAGSKFDGIRVIFGLIPVLLALLIPVMFVTLSMLSGI